MYVVCSLQLKMRRKKITAHTQNYKIPVDAHALIKFFSSSLYRQETIYTKASKKHTEQWIELVVRLYFYDSKRNEKKHTIAQLYKLKSKLQSSMNCAFQFEELLHRIKSPSMCNKEQEIIKHWDNFYKSLRSRPQSKYKHNTKTKKNSFS